MPSTHHIVMPIPKHQVPDLRSFKRHVWSYRDSGGHTVICRPPWMFTIVLDDPADLAIVADLCRTLQGAFEFNERVSIGKTGGQQMVGFADLEVLHAFLKLLSLRAPYDSVANEMASFLLSTMGIEWS